MKLNPIIIETQRLILKGFSPADMNYIFAQHTKDDVMDILGHRNESEYEKELNRYQNGYSTYNKSFLLFLLIDKLTKGVIGHCGFHNWNIEQKRAELGYDISEENCKRKGLMSEAVNEIIAYGFDKLALHRIEALVGSDNTPSLKILAKHTFVREGLLRKHYFINGKYVDSIIFSKLREEYQNELKLKQLSDK